MALTNYISHTIVTLLVFGLLFKNDYLAPLWVGPLFCISFYTLQIFISRWWLSHYQYGPLEYIWRLGTYGKMMPLKEKQGLITRPCFYASLTALCIDTGSSSTFTLRCGILNTIFKSTADALPSTIPLSVKIRRCFLGVVKIM